MILVRGLKLPPDAPAERLPALAAKKLRVPVSEIRDWKLVKRSLDARKKPDIFYLCSVAVSLRGDEKKLLARLKDRDELPYEAPIYDIPSVEPPERRPVVVGFGPAGIFAALLLALAGAKPIVLERGQDALTRRAAVEAFRAGGPLDPENNVQFGEGGAGTCSDGKLNTGTHDRRISFVLRQFFLHGAPESVVYDAKPHIGTDVLVDVVQNFRRTILSHGGEIRFGSRLERLILRGGAVAGAAVRGPEGPYELPCERLILAIGHSARDTFLALHEQGVAM